MRFICQNCQSPIDILLKLDPENVRWKITSTGAQEINESDYSKANYFTDLHLDFPVYTDKYIPGQTPFMRAVMLIGTEKILEYQQTLHLLDATLDVKEDINALIRFYLGQKIDLFRKTIHKYLPLDEFPCEKPVDINRCLYMMLEWFFAPLHRPPDTFKFVDFCSKEISNLHENNPDNFYAFIDTLIDTNFLKNTQKDSLKLYPKLLKSEVILRPTLFSDFIENPEGNLPVKISTSSFEIYKDLYKDLSEAISRMLVLIAGISNINMRGNFNTFNDQMSNMPTSLNKYVDVPLGSKIGFIDDPKWNSFVENVLDNKLRNSIAHYKVEYNEVTQIITCYPKLEGFKRERKIELSFLEFTSKVLNQFRYLHRFNHIIKIFFVHHYLRKNP
ncbi:MAG: hypothetical protein KAI70_03925 [Candidatus Omnitrophica bacterium]|nr:hypothetical protein [Candidatus Omnitrophota bacterium]